MTSNRRSYSLLHDQDHIVILIFTWQATRCYTHSYVTSNTLSYSLLHDQQHIVILIVTWPATHCHTHCYMTRTHWLTWPAHIDLHDQQLNVILIVTWPATHTKTHVAARGVDHLPHPQTHNWRSPQQYTQHTTIRSAISNLGKCSTIMACCNSPPPPDYIDTMSLSTAIDPIDTLHNTSHNKDLRVTLCT